MEPNLERPYYQDTGRRPFLFYAAFGGSAETLEVSRSRHHVEEMPQGLNLSCLHRPEHSARMDELLGGALGKVLDERDHALYEKAKAAQSLLVVYGEVQKDDTLDYLRNAIGFVQAAVETGAVAVLDLPALEFFSVQDWSEKVFSFSYHPYCHVSALISPEEGGTFWLHTRGMRKFGRPDVGLTGVPWEQLEQAKTLVDQILCYSAMGMVFSGPAKMYIGDKESFVIHPTLTGDLEDPDFNNEHYQLSWDELEFEREEDNHEDPI